jgi:WD40 repeat protein
MGDRQWAVTGQVGKSPAVFIWNTMTCDIKCRIKLPQNAREVSAVAISPDASYIATADASNDHMVSIWDVNSKNCVFTDKGGPDEIFDMAFSQKDGDVRVWSAGVKHMSMWTLDGGKKCLFGNFARTSMACVAADDQGRAFSGGANALIYVWNGTTCA